MAEVFNISVAKPARWLRLRCILVNTGIVLWNHDWQPVDGSILKVDRQPCRRRQPQPARLQTHQNHHHVITRMTTTGRRILRKTMIGTRMAHRHRKLMARLPKTGAPMAM